VKGTSAPVDPYYTTNSRPAQQTTTLTLAVDSARLTVRRVARMKRNTLATALALSVTAPLAIGCSESGGNGLPGGLVNEPLDVPPRAVIAAVSTDERLLVLGEAEAQRLSFVDLDRREVSPVTDRFDPRSQLGFLPSGDFFFMEEGSDAGSSVPLLWRASEGWLRPLDVGARELLELEGGIIAFTDETSVAFWSDATGQLEVVSTEDPDSDVLITQDGRAIRRGGSGRLILLRDASFRVVFDRMSGQRSAVSAEAEDVLLPETSFQRSNDQVWCGLQESSAYFRFDLNSGDLQTVEGDVRSGQPVGGECVFLVADEDRMNVVIMSPEGAQTEEVPVPLPEGPDGVGRLEEVGGTHGAFQPDIGLIVVEGRRTYTQFRENDVVADAAEIGSDVIVWFTSRIATPGEPLNSRLTRLTGIGSEVFDETSFESFDCMTSGDLSPPYVNVRHGEDRRAMVQGQVLRLTCLAESVELELLNLAEGGRTALLRPVRAYVPSNGSPTSVLGTREGTRLWRARDRVLVLEERIEGAALLEVQLR